MSTKACNLRIKQKSTELTMEKLLLNHQIFVETHYKKSYIKEEDSLNIQKIPMIT